jgi:hypothetical protein
VGHEEPPPASDGLDLVMLLFEVVEKVGTGDIGRQKAGQPSCDRSRHHRIAVLRESLQVRGNEAGQARVVVTCTQFNRLAIGWKL